MLVGWAGLTSLGHAGLFAMAGYVAAMLLDAGYNHFTADIAAIVVTLATTAVFAVLALRATGIGFLMITLAIGQILWGIAYRWVSLTNGDNGINVSTRPAPFGIALSSAGSFYLATLVVFLIAVATMAVFARSPFGAALRGTRDQARRMTALGYNVWLIRFLAILFSGFWSGIAGLLFIYYNQFIGPQVVALTTSAEALLMVISGGSGTLLGPIVGAAIVVIMKNVVSAYIERWNLVLGVIFILIISFMPEGLVPGSVRLWRAGWRRIQGSDPSLARSRIDLDVGGEGSDPTAPGARAMTALAVTGLNKSFGGLRVTANVDLVVEPGERRLIIGPNGAGKTTLFNLITGELSPDRGSIALFGRNITRTASRRRAHLGMARTYQIITLFPHDTILRNVTLALLGLSPLRWNAFLDLDRQHHLIEQAHQSLGKVGLDHIAERPLAQTSYGERRRVEIAMALAQSPKILLLDEPFAGLSIDERREVKKLLAAIPREVTVVMIEHNMDVALDLADRITLLHFGEVIVEGTRAEVVADPRTREVYLGT